MQAPGGAGELREHAMRAAVEARRGPATRPGTLTRVGDRPGTTAVQARRLAELERQNRELRRADTILKSASAFFVAQLDRPTDRVVASIDVHKQEFGLEPIPRVLRVGPSASPAPRTGHPRTTRFPMRT
ncbi:hypothetical protein [Nocardiopsis halophila]|uniref:hypothetical protein n=1 Tax=Nocardiopsis halophila TaxID=141692 RepID=UPI0003455AF6|nr:hypothetical protein [Nocardiopsis halophila]